MNQTTAAGTRTANLYLRRNGSFGSSYGTIQDTGHAIHEDSGRFDVWSIHDDESPICLNATRAEAQEAIAKDWDRTALAKTGGA